MRITFYSKNALDGMNHVSVVLDLGFSLESSQNFDAQTTP